MNLKQYYEKELTKLHEEAHLFSLEFPEHAASLNLEKNKAIDPNVERLMEGCAYLSARIHQMVDEEADQLPEQLIQRLWPQLSEGFPSACIAQAFPLPGLKKTLTLPKGTVLHSPPVSDEHTICSFRTPASLSIHPIRLVEVRLDHHLGETLSITLETEGLASWDTFELKELSFYVDTPRIKACGILHLLLSSASTLSIQADGKICNASGVHFKSTGVCPENLLNPCDESGLIPQQLIFEAFAFPEKIQCLTLSGLESLRVPAETKQLCISVANQKSFNASFPVNKDDMKLFALPCINHFEHDCEPILLDHKHHRYALTVDHARVHSLNVLSVLSVDGMPEVERTPVRYSPLHRIVDASVPHYSVKSQVINPEVTQVYLSFNTSTLKRESISVRAKVSNAFIPRRYIRPNQLSLVEKHYQTTVSMTNLHQPSAYLPQESTKLSQHFLQQLCVQVEQLRKIEHLKGLLFLLNRGQHAQIVKRIESMTDLTVQMKTLIRRGVFYQVQSFKITLDETGFTSVSDCFLFGMLLHAFFQQSAEMSTLIETTLICQPSEEVLTWLG